ncbi:MAG: hypothetical protein J6S67_24740 [Methanobrevibacter sp.]|nr:hypothetical protein [Methanobrevibacter sp.]
MNEQCNLCIHNNVCAHKKYYEDIEKLYENIKSECAKYPFFKFSIECTQFRKIQLTIR